MSSYYRQQLEDWLKSYDVDATTVFDVGGGQGSVKNRVGKWSVNRYEVLDLPEWDLNKQWGEHKLNKQADLVFCLEVFEYLYDPVVALKNIADLLKPGGRAIITFAFIYPHHNELEWDSLRYTEPGIGRLANAVGLEISNTWYRKDRTGQLEKFYVMDGMRRAKEYPNHSVTGFIVEFKK